MEIFYEIVLGIMLSPLEELIEALYEAFSVRVMRKSVLGIMLKEHQRKLLNRCWTKLGLSPKNPCLENFFVN